MRVASARCCIRKGKSTKAHGDQNGIHAAMVCCLPIHSLHQRQSASTESFNKTPMSTTDIQRTLSNFTCIEQALDHFDIGYDSRFIDEYRLPLMKKFNGYLILQKPDDWFSARRALKNAYCYVQRSRLDKHTRQACRGCTTCQRR